MSAKVLSQAARRQAESLSPREREVLAMLADGLTNREMAEKIGVSIRTVEAHREHIVAKLGIGRVAVLTKFALAAGLTKMS